MATYRHSLIVDMAGNLASRSRTYGRSLERMSSRGSRSMTMLSRSAGMAGRAVERLGNRYVALATGAAGVGAIRMVGNMERRFTRIGIAADKSAEQVEGLKTRLFDTANRYRVDPNGLLAGVDAILAKTGNFDLAGSNLELMALLMNGAAAAGADAGNVIAEMSSKFELKGAKEFLQTMDALARQSKMGAFEMKDMSNNSAELSAAWVGTGRTGAKAMIEMGAVIQTVMKGAGTAAEAVTRYERLLSALTIDKVDELRKRGIEVFDPEQMAKGIKVARSVPAIIKEIVVGTRGDLEEIGKVFELEAIAAIRPFAIEYQKYGGVFRELDSLLAIQGDGTQLMKDSARAAGDAAAAWQGLANSWRQVADANIAGPLKDMADAINSLKPETVQRAMKALVIGGAGLAGLWAVAATVRNGKTLIDAGRGIGRMGRRGGAGAFAGAAGAAGGMGIVNVRVINWPATMGRNIGVGPARGGARGGATGRALSRMGGVTAGALALGAFGTMSVLGDDTMSGKEKTDAVGRIMGGTGGALAGAKFGAMAGALAGPLAPFAMPAGALAGGALGYMAGESGGGWLARELRELLDREGRAGKAEAAKIDVDVNFGGNVPPGMRTSVKGPDSARIRTRQTQGQHLGGAGW